MIGDIMIGRSAYAFYCCRNRSHTQKEVWIQKGNLIDAVRASIAIPTVFTPKKIDKRYLIDGGVLNPLPIAPTVADDTDLTIAVDLSAHVAKKHTIIFPKKNMKKESDTKDVF
jgi:NTE family protein